MSNFYLKNVITYKLKEKQQKENIKDISTQGIKVTLMIMLEENSLEK